MEEDKKNEVQTEEIQDESKTEETQAVSEPEKTQTESKFSSYTYDEKQELVFGIELKEKKPKSLSEISSDAQVKEIEEKKPETEATEENPQDQKKNKKFRQKLQSSGKAVLNFAKKHKVLVSIFAVVIVIAVAVLIVANHYLNKINIVDTDDSSVSAEIQKRYITLQSGEIIEVSALSKNADDSYYLPDGRRFNEDGTIWLTDGTVVFYDGSYILSDGTVVLADGTTFYPDGSLVFQSGKHYSNSNVETDKDGYMTFPCGVVAHITSFTCDESAHCKRRVSMISDVKNPSELEWEIFPDKSGTFANTTAKDKDDDDDSDDAAVKQISNGKGGVSDDSDEKTVTYAGGEAVTNSKGETVTNSNGKAVTHASGETVTDSDGKAVTRASGSDSKSKTTTTAKSVEKTEDEEDEAFEKALKDSSDKLQSDDEKIAKNYNDNEIWYSDNIKNILLMGIDQGSDRYPYGRSDSMIILSINQKTKDVKMVSLSRATYVAITGYNNSRLNHAHGYGGATLAIDTIERNFKIRIDNFVETGFSTFKQIVDQMGGVTIKLTDAEAKALKSKLKKAGLKYTGAGKYKLNGEVALNYVRLRKIDTDRERTARQRKVLMAMVNKVKNMSAVQLTNLADKILPLITTDMEKSDIISQLTNLSTYLNGNISQYVIPHETSALTLVGEYEVLLVDWETEVPYIKNLFYEGQKAKTCSR